jgi:hypothetical protein
MGLAGFLIFSFACGRGVLPRGPSLRRGSVVRSPREGSDSTLQRPPPATIGIAGAADKAAVWS